MKPDLSIAQTLTQAVAHHRAGRLQQAEQGYRKVLAANPRHANALHLLGVAELHAGKPDAAIHWIGKSIAVNAGTADVHLNLGNAYQAANKTDAALDAYRRAIKLRPGLAAAHSALSNALAKTNALQDAIVAARKAISCDPKSIDGHKNLGIALHKAGSEEAALDAYQAALALSPADAELHNNLGHALHVLGRNAEAVAHLRKATELAPQFGPAWFTLGNVLKLDGQLQPAAQAFSRAIELMPRHVESHIDLAAAHQLAGNFDRALRWLNRAIEINPRSAIARNNRAGVLQRLGRNDEAVAAFQTATELDPSLSSAWGNLALFHEQNNRLNAAQAALQQGLAHAPDDALLNLVAAKHERRAGASQAAIQRLQRVQALQPKNTHTDKIYFELGRLYDQVEDTERAFVAFDRANELTRSKPSARFFANESYRTSIDALLERITAEWYSGWQRVDTAESRTPIFLLGFPRSGTTLLDQILDSHPRLTTLDEQALVNTLVKKVAQMPRSYPDQLQAVTTADVDVLRHEYWQLAQAAIDLSADQILVDKFPLNIVHVPLIHRLFPNAKFILALRHPCDVCLSCYMQEFELNDAMVNLLALDSTVALYDQVMRLWQQYTQVLKLDYHAIKYENVVTDIEQEARALLQFAGVDWDASVLQFAEHARARGKINTPSYHQVTQPIYQHAKYRWQRYGKYLQPFFETLRPHCEAFDYDLQC